MTLINTTLRPTRKMEKWNIIFNQLPLDVTKPYSVVTANQIKAFSKEEPRLMAKMDTLDSLPQVFRENDLFLVPVSRGKYAIIKGKGYHKLEPFSEKTNTYYTNLPFPTSVLGINSENVFLEYANSCGLLERVTGIGNLIQTFRGRRTTSDFNFQINNIIIGVNKAQIEVDAVFDKQQKLYQFWEYEFSPRDHFESIKLIKNMQYKIRVSNVISTKQYQNVMPIKTKLDIPQADDVNKIMQFPLRVFEGL